MSKRRQEEVEEEDDETEGGGGGMADAFIQAVITAGGKRAEEKMRQMRGRLNPARMMFEGAVEDTSGGVIEVRVSMPGVKPTTLKLPLGKASPPDLEEWVGRKVRVTVEIER